MPSCGVPLLGHRWETLKPYPPGSVLMMLNLPRKRASAGMEWSGELQERTLCFQCLGHCSSTLLLGSFICFLCMDFFSPEAWLLLLEACVRWWGWVPVFRALQRDLSHCVWNRIPRADPRECPLSARTKSLSRCDLETVRPHSFKGFVFPFLHVSSVVVLTVDAYSIQPPEET